MARLLGCLLVLGAAVAVFPNAGALVLLLPGLAAFLYARTHISAVAMGLAGALLWLDLVVLLPPVPSAIGLAVVFAAAAAAGTLWITRRPVLALHTAVTATLGISAFAWLLLVHGPDRFVPPLTAGPYPLAQSRIETPDHYLWLLAIGAALSLGLIIVTARTRRSAKASAPVERLFLG